MLRWRFESFVYLSLSSTSLLMRIRVTFASVHDNSRADIFAPFRKSCARDPSCLLCFKRVVWTRKKGGSDRRRKWSGELGETRILESHLSPRSMSSQVAFFLGCASTCDPSGFVATCSLTACQSAPLEIRFWIIELSEPALVRSTARCCLRVRRSVCQLFVFPSPCSLPALLRSVKLIHSFAHGADTATAKDKNSKDSGGGGDGGKNTTVSRPRRMLRATTGRSIKSRDGGDGEAGCEDGTTITSGTRSNEGENCSSKRTASNSVFMSLSAHSSSSSSRTTTATSLLSSSFLFIQLTELMYVH